jgi:outer membrane protein assembly factor BamB
MKISRLTLIIPVLLLSVILSACSGVQSLSWPGLTASQDLAYVAFGQYVYAVRLSDGSMAWRYPEKADTAKSFYAAPVLTPDGQLLVGDYVNTLYSLDPKTSTVKWTFKDAKGRWIASPLVTEDSIYAPSGDGNLYALDFQGKLRWKFTTKNALWATPVIAGSTIYQPSMDHYLYAVNAADGKELWKLDLKGALVSSPVLSPDGILYVGTFTKELVAVDIKEHVVVTLKGEDPATTLWPMATEGGVWGTPLLIDGNLYFGDLSGKIYAKEAKSGKVIWTAKPVPGGAVASSPTQLPGGLLAFCMEGELAIVDQTTGNIVRNPTISGKLYNSPVYINEKLLVTSVESENILVAFDQNGNQLWPFKPPK